MGKHYEVTESAVFSLISSDVIFGQRTGVITQLVGRVTVVTSFSVRDETVNKPGIVSC